jgi:hypothetical protein
LALGIVAVRGHMHDKDHNANMPFTEQPR